MRKFLILILFASFFFQEVSAQTVKIDKVQFFLDETPLQATVVLNMSRLLSNRSKLGMTFPAEFKCQLSDGTEVNEKIRLEIRGHSRRETCYIPPLRLRFNNPTSPVMSPMKTLKLVNPCMNKEKDNSYLLKEYLVYKIHNIITDMSFRARLVNITYVDSASKKVLISRNSFLLEDIADVAKRNNCLEAKRSLAHSESAQRMQNTIVYMFEYMIGNTDWAIPVRHNIRLIAPKDDTTKTPFAIPYDFDNAGLVNTNYAEPNPILPISMVTERLYRGFSRTIEELQSTAAIFKQKEEQIKSLINNFELLPEKERKEMLKFLQPFFNTIANQQGLRSEFIRNARVD